jgi:ABC-type transport system involved in cytochrome bd biosynthesis fused ATPase/permease subunit
MLAWFGALIVLSGVVDHVFLHGSDGPQVRSRVLVLLGMVAARAVLSGAGEWASENAGASLVRTLRGRLTEALFRLGPVPLRRERAGDLVRLGGDGVETVGSLATGPPGSRRSSFPRSWRRRSWHSTHGRS